MDEEKENGKYQLEIGLKALVELLDEFRIGNIFNRNVEKRQSDFSNRILC